MNFADLISKDTRFDIHRIHRKRNGMQSQSTSNLSDLRVCKMEARKRLSWLMRRGRMSSSSSRMISPSSVLWWMAGCRIWGRANEVADAESKRGYGLYILNI